MTAVDGPEKWVPEAIAEQEAHLVKQRATEAEPSGEGEDGNVFRAAVGLATKLGEVGPKCDDTSAPGSWYCVTHDLGFVNNMSLHSHTGEDKQRHEVAWLCSAHGIETP